MSSLFTASADEPATLRQSVPQRIKFQDTGNPQRMRPVIVLLQPYHLG